MAEEAKWYSGVGIAAHRGVGVVGLHDPPPVLEFRAAAQTVLLRRHVVIIETRIEQQIPWLEFIRKAAPKLPIRTVHG